MKVDIKKMMLLFLLLDNFYLKVNLGFDFRINYIVFFIYLIYTLLSNKRVFINKNILVAIGGFFLLSLLVAFLKGSPYLLVFKQIVLVAFNLSFAYALINEYKFDVLAITKDYIQLIFGASIIGLVQFISQNVGFFYGADFTYLGLDMGYYSPTPGVRVQSWFYEPSFLVYAFMPIVFIIIARFFDLHRIISLQKSVIILLVFVLSNSSIGYFGILISILLVVGFKYSFLRKPKSITILSVFFMLVSIAVYKIPDVKLRVDDTITLFFDSKITGKDIDATNLSTYALFSNYKITKRSLFENPILGTGLGTYEYNYDEYLNEEIPKSKFRKYYKINRSDGNSLFLRLLTELGLFGIFAFFYFLLSTRVRGDYIDMKEKNVSIYWVINNGIFVLILLRLLRQGHYTMLGFVLFLLMYFYSFKAYNERIKKALK